MQELNKLITQLKSGDDSLAEIAVKEIGQLGISAIEKLAELLKDKDADVRWWAIRTLAEFKDDQASQLILIHLEDHDLAVQQCAAIALRFRPSENAIEPLITLLEHDDPILSELAANALITYGKSTTQALLDVVQKGSPKAQIQAVRALAKIKDTVSIPALFSLLDSDSAMLAYWANEGLENMGVGMLFFNPD